MAKFYQGFNKAEKIFMGFIMLFLIAMGLAQVLCRFVFQVTLAWAEEMMTFCMVWVAYLGADAATNEKKHILVSVLVNAFPKKVAKILTVASQVVWCMICSGMVYLGYQMTMKYIARGARTLGGGYPYWVASMVIPISMLFMAVRVVLLIISTIKGENDERTIEEIIEEEKAE